MVEKAYILIEVVVGTTAEVAGQAAGPSGGAGGRIAFRPVRHRCGSAYGAGWPDAYDDALEEPFVAAMDFKSATQRGWYTSTGKGFVRTILSLGGLGGGVEFAFLL